MKATGGTPLGPALKSVCNTMMFLREKRKMVIIITDGAPDSVSEVKEAVALCRRMKIETYGVGLDCDSLSNILKDDEWVVINGVEDLVSNLFRIVEGAVL